MKSVKSFPLKDLLKDVRSGFACGEEAPDGIFQIRMNNITREGQLDFSKKRLVPATHRAIPKSILKSGDILFNATNSPDLVGKTALFRGSEEPIVFSNHFLRLQVDDSRVFSSYLTRWLQLRYTQGKFKSMCRQWVNQATVDKDALMTLQVPLPPLDEQRRIAAVLDKVDALRAKRRESIALLDDLTQSVFLDMFGDPATNYKGWPLKRMDSLFSTKPNYGTMTPAAEQGSWLCLRVANIQDWKLNLTDQKYVDLPSSALERHSVLDGDLLLARAIATQEQLGKAIVAYPGDQKWAFDSHLMRIRFDQNKAKPEFVSTLLRTPGGRSLFLKRTRRSSVQFNINTKEISALRIPVPPIDLQREFIDRLSAITSLKSSYRAHLSHLDELFASLQQRAFRGDLFSSEAA